MKKFFKVLGILLLVVVVGVISLISYVKLAMPNVGPAPDLKVDMSPENIARGEYLANHVMACMDCHATRNWDEFSGPMTPGTLGNGGERFDQKFGLPGVYYSANITPFGLKDWTDGEIYRAITTGVRKNGKPIFDIMPYQAYGTADPEDIKAIIAYIRSIPSIEKTVPESVSDFPMNIIINTIPKKAAPEKRPSETDQLNYGKYLVRVAGCQDCHTPFDKGTYDMNFRLAGGRSFQFYSGVITTPNLTPDEETGLGKWSKEMFVARFKQYVDSNNMPVHTPVQRMKDFNSIMPWTMFGGMKTTDLEAIYTYLHSLQPLKHAIVRFVPNNQ